MATLTPNAARSRGGLLWPSTWLDALLAALVLLLAVALISVLIFQPGALQSLVAAAFASGSATAPLDAEQPQQLAAGGQPHQGTQQQQQQTASLRAGALMFDSSRQKPAADAQAGATDAVDAEAAAGAQDGGGGSGTGAGAGTESLVCTPAAREAQLQRFQDVRNLTSAGQKSGSGVAWACMPRLWLPALQKITRGEERITMADVGGGFGYLSAQLMHAFAPQLGISKHSLFAAYKNLVPGADTEPLLACSRTCDHTLEACTHVEPAAVAPAGRSVEVHSFEPSQMLAERLAQARNKLISAAPEEAVERNKWVIHNVPLSRQVETVHWPSTCDGDACAISQFARPGTEPVQASSFDEMHQGGLTAGITWTVISVRSPGHEPAVLMGMQRVLSDQLVNVLEFTVHPNLGLWLLTRLSKLIVWLESLGMACFLEGPASLYKLSAQCWDDGFLLDSPSRVVCARIESRFEEALDQLVDLSVPNN